LIKLSYLCRVADYYYGNYIDTSFQSSSTLTSAAYWTSLWQATRDGDFGGSNQPDRFIIKVYALGADPGLDEPIYKASGDLEGGNIVIHAKK